MLKKKIGNIKIKLINAMIKVNSSLLLVILISIFTSCSQDNQTKVSSVEISYLKGHIEFAKGLNCDQISSGLLLDRSIVDTIITDSQILNKLDSLLGVLKFNSSKFSVDSRIKCEIKFNSGKTKTLCIGEKSGIKYGSDYYNENLLLLFLIKRNSGYYQYFPYNDLKFFSELKDSVRLNITLNKMEKKVKFNDIKTLDGEIIKIIRY